jgi:hypothetical protein
LASGRQAEILPGGHPYHRVLDIARLHRDATVGVPATALTAPTITSLTPGTNTVGGGAFVQITGTNFVAGAAVTFGGIPATAVPVTSGTQITCQTPPHAFGFVTVTVTNPDTAHASLPNALRYTSSGTPPPA